jgi:hypothetical protein
MSVVGTTGELGRNVSYSTHQRNFMKKILLPLLALPAIFIAGCIVTSVYPFYTEKDLTFDPALVGRWTENTTSEPGNVSSELWEFAKAGENEYAFIITDTDKTNNFSAHLFKLGGQRFLDWVATESSDGFVPPHYLLRVRQISPTLQLEPMSAAWLKDLLKKNPDAVRHIVLHEKRDNSTDDRTVLTADTRELQKFVLKYMNDPKAFGDEPIELKRQEIAKK